MSEGASVDPQGIVDRDYKVQHELNKQKAQKKYADAPKGQKGLALLTQVIDNTQLIINEQQSALDHLRANLPEIVAQIKADK